MNIYEDIVNGQETLGVVGLGYVGLPIAIAFARKVNVLGFDVNSDKIDKYRQGIDPTNEVGNQAIAESSMSFTSNEEDLRTAKVLIVAVPTPINRNHTPDLTPLEEASRIVGRNLSKGAVVVFESTVFPGVTEDICIPILENESGLKAGHDFKVGYSPERINPGDKVNRLETITKIVSGMDNETLAELSLLYELIIEAGVHRAPSIKVAEAAKVIENAQRDINIAFMNELAMIFNRLDIDTNDVLEAASTKWNFLPFYPGLVGGHCIGVDPYYLTYKAEQEGYYSKIILAGRQINDDMGRFIVENTIKKLIQSDITIKQARIGILGFTFKENIPDSRNSRVIDIINELKEYGIQPVVVDPVADTDEVIEEYGIRLDELSELHDMDALIFAVKHEEFLSLGMTDIDQMFKANANHKKIIMDVKGFLKKMNFNTEGYNYWTL